VEANRTEDTRANGDSEKLHRVGDAGHAEGVALCWLRAEHAARGVGLSSALFLARSSHEVDWVVRVATRAPAPAPGYSDHFGDADACARAVVGRDSEVASLLGRGHEV